MGANLFYSNRYLTMILNYTGTGFSEHGIYHDITDCTYK